MSLDPTVKQLLAVTKRTMKGVDVVGGVQLVIVLVVIHRGITTGLTMHQQPAIFDKAFFAFDANPYEWLTLEEFQYHVDMKLGGVEKVTEDQILDKFPELYGGFSCVIELITELANGELDPVEFRKFVLTEEAEDA